MNAYIRKNVLGHVPKLPISDVQFDAASQARVVLAATFALEESYDLLIGNYPRCQTSCRLKKFNFEV
ncbi:MAG: hypothetical protein WCK93_11600, partial [Nitrosomonadales bacterium]